MKRKLTLITVLLFVTLAALHASDPPIILWPQGAPGALGTTSKDNATITPYLPAIPSGAAILIVPGGSYAAIYQGQTEPFALWLNEQGVTAFVLRYRLGSSGYRYPSQLQDAVEAMRQIRGQAEKWNIDPHRIGAMGFSAGGHLLTTLLNHPEDGEVQEVNPEGRVSPRPDLAIICYPVISMIVKPHGKSRENLLGTTPDEGLIRRTSSELQVREGLPPCFVWHTGEDKLVPVIHSLLFVNALQEHGVSYEFHIYQKGGHGTGLMDAAHPWRDDLLFWLHANKFITDETK